MSTDPGLQPERTSLAWRRTGLAAATASAAMVRVAVMREAPVVAALCAGLVVVSLGALLEGSVGGRSRRRWFEGDTEVSGLSLVARASVAAVALLAVAGLGLLLST